ncbi:hypothetical protein [Arthrobacter sp. UYCo732]|uniref:hypothetical protein n=1 Tax=Arthrobacter sp. UYCo732 TaxID=3156336 RepID=UPI00339B2BDC
MTVVDEHAKIRKIASLRMKAAKRLTRGAVLIIDSPTGTAFISNIHHKDTSEWLLEGDFGSVEEIESAMMRGFVDKTMPMDKLCALGILNTSLKRDAGMRMHYADALEVLARIAERKSIVQEAARTGAPALADGAL